MSDDRTARIGRWRTAAGDAIVPPRIAYWLETHAQITPEFRIRLRLSDPIAYDALMALHSAAMRYDPVGADLGPDPDPEPPQREEWDPWLTIRDVAEELGRHDRTIRKWCERQRIPARQSRDGQWRIHRHDLEAYKLTA